MLRKGMFISDRYEIIDKVGSGGMSDVYKAKCHKLNRFVAIKVLKPEFSEDKNFVSKFKVEAQSAAGLAHPNIVSVFDVGEDNGLHYIVMELVEGITLKKYIEKKGRLSVKEAVSIAIQVAQGIEAAHNNHIIHRDIKPQNIIISREGKVKVTDFGIARAASANTINSNAMGSVHYISPEQARGGFIDEKSDIYSLGISLYEMITGNVPFEGDTTVTIALQHIQGEIPPAKNTVPDLPISVEKIIEKCTQKKADRRYLKVSSLIADLKRSLITPDEDFVQMVPTMNNQATIMISDDDVALIRRETGMSGEIDEDMIDEDTADLSSLEEDADDLDDFDDEEEDNPKLDKIVAIGGIVTGVLILAVVAFLGFSIFKNGIGGGNADKKPGEPTTTLDNEHTKMPDLTGCTEKEAIDKIKKADLGYQVEEQHSNTVEEGYVISASVEYGTVVEKNTKIIIQISLGAELVDMPSDLVGKTKDDAIAALNKLNLNLTYDIDYQEDSNVEMDVVISTKPAPPEQIKYGDTITITVSKGTASSTDAIVPQLTGLSEDAARAEASKAGLVLVVSERRYDDNVAEGLVISQDVKQNEKLPAGSTVNVIISKGKEKKCIVPNLNNCTIEEARAKLAEAGLTLGTETGRENSDTVPEGSICGQSIEAGTEVEEGTAVNYTISLGSGETQPPDVYKASVTIRKKDIVSKLEPDEDGNYTGTVVIKVDGSFYDGFDSKYSDLSNWPDSWTLDLPDREEPGTVTVEIYVNDVSSVVYTYDVKYKK
ncbi:MAG: Stk1 family PASTA domain-containing Ser/Thr kinase [Lachnospiraceae bacterium]|nr:Stk1 family PASTA domain-containing Ser/Thr kinase [Lachnospiraceae bacterium]